MLDARLSQAEKLINLTSKVNSEVSSSKTKLLTITSGKGGVRNLLLQLILLIYYLKKI